MKTAGNFLTCTVLGLAIFWAFAPLSIGAEYQVQINDFFFDPVGLNINVGDTVTWRNVGVFTHTATSDSGIFDSGLLSRNQTYSFAFLSSGTYPYHCDVHISMRDTIFVGSESGIDDVGINSPAKFELSQNYPNPFNAATVISYALPEASHVTVDIYDILGHRVAKLFDGEQGQGNHKLVWNALDRNSGVFLYRVTANGATGTGLMTLLK